MLGCRCSCSLKHVRWRQVSRRGNLPERGTLQGGERGSEAVVAESCREALTQRGQNRRRICANCHPQREPGRLAWAMDNWRTAFRR